MVQEQGSAGRDVERFCSGTRRTVRLHFDGPGEKGSAERCDDHHGEAHDPTPHAAHQQLEGGRLSGAGESFKLGLKAGEELRQLGWEWCWRALLGSMKPATVSREAKSPHR
jgi:hypothetical protein